MNVLALFLHLAAILFSAPRQLANPDSIQTINADGERAHDISANMMDGKSVTLLHSDGGMLWLGNVSYNHRWFEMLNRGWSKKKQANLGVVICDVSSMKCKPEDDMSDSTFAFDRFLDKSPEFQMISKNRVNGKFAKRILPLDSFEVRFKSADSKYILP